MAAIDTDAKLPAGWPSIRKEHMLSDNNKELSTIVKLFQT